MHTTALIRVLAVGLTYGPRKLKSVVHKIKGLCSDHTTAQIHQPPGGGKIEKCRA
jgi:hypothetical protein